MPRWALAPFAWVPLWVGFRYTFSARSRYSSPAYDAAKHIALALIPGVDPMRLWGIVCLAIAAAMLLAIAVHLNAQPSPAWRRWLLTGSLLAQGAFVTWWGCLQGLQADLNDHVPDTSFGYFTGLGFAYLLAALRVASGPPLPKDVTEVTNSTGPRP
jgi:hypothetical protein